MNYIFVILQTTYDSDLLFFYCLPRSLGPVIYYALVNSRSAHALPSNFRALIARIVSPGGGELANYVRPRGRAFANLWATPELLVRTCIPF